MKNTVTAANGVMVEVRADPSTSAAKTMLPGISW